VSITLCVCVLCEFSFVFVTSENFHCLDERYFFLCVFVFSDFNGLAVCKDTALSFCHVHRDSHIGACKPVQHL
jgi:hypothetical protein